MRRPVFLFVFIFLSFYQVAAQCYCEDCTVPIISDSPTSATISISGSTNNILGVGGQSLVNVGVQFRHNAVQELNLRIVAPDGSFVDLTPGDGSNLGSNVNFDMDFIQCGASAIPDCTNNPTWFGADNWGQGPYVGSYYPESGCLEDLTGDINGTWTLEMDDSFIFEDGELFCFDLTFADETGINCNFSTCDEAPCLAQGGSGISPFNVFAPEGDPSLEIDFTPSYSDCELPANEPEYVYVYFVENLFVVDTVHILENPVDMTGFDEGVYGVYGLSILASDLPTILALDFTNTSLIDIILLISTGDICADLMIGSSIVFIEACELNFSATLESDIIMADVGDPALDPSWMISWTPSAPDFTDWGLYYVVYNPVTEEIIDYLTTDDFTGLSEGEYFVKALVYRLNDESEIPPANGVNVLDDLENAISDDICGFLFGLNELIITLPCSIEVNGTLELDIITAPAGDSALDPNWDITFAGTPPDPTIYGFYYVVYDADTDVLIDFLTTDDFTGLPEGNYNVTMLYFLLDDELLIPTVNGTNTFLDIETAILDEILCAQYFGQNQLIISAPCVADAGSFTTTVVGECEGDVALNLDLTPQYSGTAPDAATYGYTYVVSENGVVIAIDASTDFTAYAVGEYEVCGLSYLLTDESSLPTPNGSLTTADIQNDIDNQVYCADLTTVCVALSIVEQPVVNFTGPTEVCVGEEVQYVVENFTGNNFDYLFIINQGGFSQFINDGNGTLSVIWSSGPGNICAIQIDNGCEGETCLTIDVVDQVTVTIDGLEEVCPGEEVVYVLSPVPDISESYFIVVDEGMITNQTNNTVTILWDDNFNPGSVTATLNGGDCTAIPTTLNVNKFPDVEFPMLTIPETSCINTELTIPDINDPNIIDWEWTATNADILIQAGFVNFTWQSIGVAQICLEITTVCGTEQMCYDVTVSEAPEPFIEPQLEFCSLSFTLEATPSVGNSWLWTSSNPADIVLYSNQTSFVTDVVVTGPGTYQFTLQEIGENCIGTVETTVTIVDGLSTSDPVAICDDNGFYTMTFDVTSGSAPFTVNGITIGGNIFVSNDIASGDSYLFEVEDSEGCVVTVDGSYTCPCTSDAGTMSPEPIILCISEDFDGQGIHNNDATLDFDDIGLFILHTEDAGTLGDIISINASGVFSFDALNMDAGQVYYISYVVGNEIAGNVDVLDPCLSIAAGQPIIFYEDPVVDAGNDAETCELIFELSANSITTEGVWSITSQPDESVAELQVISQSTFVVFDMPGTYTFVLENTEFGCLGTDEVLITFLDSPAPSNLSTVCDGNLYTVSFDIEGGSLPYFVNGEQINGSTFTSEQIASGEVYGFAIVDSEGCESDFVEGTEVCNCTTDAGTMSQEEIVICAIEGTLISGTFNNDATFDSNDGGLFILHTGSSNILGDIIHVDMDSQFPYFESFGVGVTLYLSYVAGDSLNTGVELSDDCLSVAVGQPITFEPLLKTDAGDYADQCDFNFMLNANDQGAVGSWSVIESPTDANITFGNESDAQSSFETDRSGIYRIVWSPSSSPCIEPDTAVFELTPLLTIENQIITCSEDLQTYTVEVEISGGLSPYFLNGNEVNGIFELDPAVSGSMYSYVLTDSRGCELDLQGSAVCSCTNQGGTMSLDTLKGCVTDTLVGTYNNDAVPDMDDRELFVLHTSPTDMIGTVFFISEDPQVFFVPGLIAGNVYYLSHVMGNVEDNGIDFEDPCLKISVGQPVVFNALPEAQAGADMEICGFMTVLSGLSSEVAFSWSVIESPIGASVELDENDLNSELSVSDPGLYVLTLKVDNGYCVEMDSIEITFIEPLNYQDVNVNCSADGYTVSFNVVGGMGPYTVDGAQIEGDFFESGLFDWGEQFTFSIADNAICPPIAVFGTDNCDCENDAGTMAENLLSVCEDDIIDLNSLNNGNAILDENDVQYHVIHTSPTNELGEVIGFVQQMDGIQSLSFTDFNFELDVIYYVSTVLANMGVLENGDSDPCLKIAEGVPIVWVGNSEASIIGDRQGCIGESIFIEITASGILPIGVDFFDELGFSQTVFIDQELFLLEYVVTGNTSLTMNIPVTANCLNIPNSTIFISTVELPEAEVQAETRVCNNASFSSVVELDALIVSGFQEGRWFLNETEVDVSINFDGMEAGVYNLEYVIENEECEATQRYPVIVTVEECDCPMFNYLQSDVTCFGASDGAIFIQVMDGIDLSEYSILLNDIEQATDTDILNLASGDYRLDIADENNCVASFDIIISEPEAVQISLGEDMEVEINDPVIIEAITNLLDEEIEGITWSSLSGVLEENDLMLNTSFREDDIISISILDENGCTGTDDIMVRVTFDDYVIPNVIRRNSTSGNDIFRIFNTSTINEVVRFSVFDRWGNRMYGVENVLPDSEEAQWDGTFGGEEVNPGVYVYRMVLDINGEQRVVLGDLTVM